MTTRKFACLLLIILSCTKNAIADTFIVTSNADSGPGSLREAITLANANGTGLTDYINFTIADVSVTGRTITLQSSLELSSNLVVDGTTQPGIKFGVSDSKIKIVHGGAITLYQAMILSDVDHVELYGLYFTGFFNKNPAAPAVIACAIYTPGIVSNLKIGAPGKGNVFYDNLIAIANRYSYSYLIGDLFTDAEIKSNFFNLNEDGVTISPLGIYAIELKLLKNLTIGGNSDAEGNFFAGHPDEIIHLFANNNPGNGFLKILHNSFGSDFSKTIPLKCGAVYIAGITETSVLHPSDLIITISKNTFNNPLVTFTNYCHGMLSIYNISGFITITGNAIGNLSNFQSCQTTGIGIAYCENGIIGGSNPDDYNSIGINYVSGISLYNNKNITIQKNSIYCNSQGITAVSDQITIPKVKIMSSNDVDFISGTADPNCKIEVFESPDCIACNNGKIFLGETISDNNGNWSFTGNFNNAVTATATNQNGATGEFAKADFNISLIEIKNPQCGQNVGSILGIQFISGSKYYWVKNSIDTIYNQLNLTDLEPGRYEFVAEQTKYCSKTYSILLTDDIPDINELNTSVIQPSCGHSNGSIVGISASGTYQKIYWLSESRDTVGNLPDLLNTGAGKYKLIIQNSIYGCADSTDWFILTNQAGPSLNLNNINITASTCNNSNGNITNITTSGTTGTPFIQWIDSLNNPVGNTLNLLNVPAGKYKLKFKDESGCDTIITPYYTVNTTGLITVDTTGKIVTPSSCTAGTGSIQNIQVTGASIYQWINTVTNIPAGSTLSVNNLSPGSYQLTASNATGCSVVSQVINVLQAAFSPISVTNSQSNNATCAANNGSINITGFSTAAASYSFNWINKLTNQLTGSGTSINNLGAGTYLLIATDMNGCEKEIFSTTLQAFPKPSFDLSGLIIENDQCSLQIGKISGIKINGLSGNSTTYTWTDANSTTAGTNLSVQNVGAGVYTLTVTDAGTCTIQSAPFVVDNNNNADILPQYENLIIPRFTATTLTVKNLQTGTYYLYSDAAATQLLQQNNSGIFITATLPANTDFFIKHVNGTCTSSLTNVKVTVVDKSFFAIPSAFTPNNDGKNDKLNLKVTGYINVEYFKIYNRNGEEVFSTKTINDGWNGIYHGSLQTSSVFVWIAKGKDLLGNTITDKGTFVLIR